MNGPLAGVRVLDFGLLTAGANTSAMLADLGADVLKIESGAYLDPFRVVGKMDDDDGWWNRSPQFRFTNRNKRGLALNLKDPEGQRVIRELAAHCDVVVENFRRGVLDRAGLGYEALKAINPRIVFAAISSQGDTGPERMNVSFGSTLDATSGIASLTGYEGEEPRISGMDVNYPDQIVSLFATGIVITAVMEARRTGKGCVPRLLPARGRLLHPGRGDPGRIGRSVPSACAARQHAKTAWRSRTPIAARTDAGSPSRSPRRSRARRLLRRAGQRRRRGGAAGARHRGRAVQRRQRPAAATRALAGVTLVRDEQRRAGEGPALPARRQGHHHRTRRARSRPAHR